ncbi:hypothetical protein [Nocardia pneumoniae]|uniref:hypothetical protein n=1 Tax=Nocardia pneumoniae TaxID=228601 RepID=UPI0012F664D7|nr:hypothetical protein [Nocardia pneumoniae]
MERVRQRAVAGAISGQQLSDPINQLMKSTTTQSKQLQDSVVEQLQSIGAQHPEWPDIILAVLEPVSNLLYALVDKKRNLLESLASNTDQQAATADQFFSDSAGRFTDAWGQIVGCNRSSRPAMPQQPRKSRAVGTSIQHLRQSRNTSPGCRIAVRFPSSPVK